MLSGLLNLIRGYDTRLSDLEKVLLAQLSNELSDSEAGKLDRRLKNIKKIQRSDGGREVLMYEYRSEGIVFPPETKIETRHQLSKFAKFDIVSDDKMTENKGSIFMMQGNICAISYSKPTEHADTAKIDHIELTIIDAECQD